MKLFRNPFTVLIALMTVFGLSAAFAQEGQQQQDMAMVRIAHLSPNAPNVDVRLLPDEGQPQEGQEGQEGQVQAVEDEALQGLAYQDITDYVMVPAGGYLATVSEAGAEQPLLEANVTLDAGTRYTVAAMGLAPEGEQEGAAETGAVAGEGAVGTDLRLELLTDTQVETGEAVEQNVSYIRVVHAAPGTENVDVALAQQQDDSFVTDLAFGDASEYESIEPGSYVFEVRITGSDTAALETPEVELVGGVPATMFIVGTAVDDDPLEVFIVADTDAANNGE